MVFLGFIVLQLQAGRFEFGNRVLCCRSGCLKRSFCAAETKRSEVWAKLKRWAGMPALFCPFAIPSNEFCRVGIAEQGVAAAAVGMEDEEAGRAVEAVFF